MPRTYLTRSAPDTGEVEHRRWMFRHPAVIRITHWVNALCLLVLLTSGLQIFNAHPALYWGKVSTFDTPLLAMSQTDDDPPKGRWPGRRRWKTTQCPGAPPPFPPACA